MLRNVLRRAMLSLFVSLACSVLLAAAEDAAAILKASDHARGGGLPGISWKVEVHSVDGGRNQNSVLTVKASAENSLVEYQSPARLSGQKLLMAGKNMWFFQPGIQRPVPISPRQKLTGQAAFGDIAATNYASDYSAVLDREEDCGPERCAVLRLKAASKGVTYDQITYWISLGRKVGVKAEFYSVSGKLFKSATFEYANRISHGGVEIPFVSRMVITDALNEGNVTSLIYSGARAARIAPTEFNADLLGR